MSTPSPSNPLNRIACAIGTFFFRWRNTLFPIIFIATALVVRPAPFLNNSHADLITTILGTLIATAGQLIRCATIGLAYIVRGGKDRRVYADNLVQDGIYAHTRNPMYLGNLLIAAGFCLLYGSPWMYAGVFPFFWIVYLCIVRTEERYLAQKFGADYEHYRRTVPAFWPRTAGLVNTLADHTFNWKKVISKEYGTLFTFSVGLYGLLLYKRGLFTPPQSCCPLQYILLLTSPVILFFVAYLAARILKKTGRLGPP